MTVPRVQEVIVIETPEPPAPRARKRQKSSAALEKKKAALEAAPSGFVVDSYYDGGGDLQKAQQSARNAAYQVNVGERQEWPAATYYGVFRISPKGDRAELAIGLREHMAPEWEDFVNRAGSRKNKAQDSDDVDQQEESSDESAQEDPFEGESA